MLALRSISSPPLGYDSRFGNTGIFLQYSQPQGSQPQDSQAMTGEFSRS